MLLRMLSITILLALCSCEMPNWRGIPRSVQLDEEARNLLADYGRQLAEDYDLEFLCLATGQIVDHGRAHYCLNFVSRKSHTLEESQQLATTLAQLMYKKVCDEPIFEEARAAKAEKSRHAPKAIVPETFALKLSYWTEDVDRPKPPLIAQVRVIGTDIFYYTADGETQALREPPTHGTWSQLR